MSEQNETKKPQGPMVLMVRGVIRMILSFVCWGALIFWPAGTMDWTEGWIHLGSWFAVFIVNLVVLFIVNREVLLARMEIHKGTEKFDKLIMVFMGPASLAVLVVAGLDAVRYQWSVMSGDLLWVGLAMHVVGNVIMLWSLSVNPFLEKTVRIQDDRGHKVVTKGPYALIRHPLYLGVFFALGAVPFVLRSWWSFVPVGVTLTTIVIRTAFEDGILHRKLEGYSEYARKTKWRLFPFVW